MDGRDQVFAFDGTGSGKLNHLFLYRPGSPTYSIVAGNCWDQRLQAHIELHFGTVFSASDIGKLDDELAPFMFKRFNNLRGFAIDCYSQGKLDHLLFYRPGTGIVCIIKRDGTQFRVVHDTLKTKAGIGGYDLSSPSDRIIAFDCASASRPGYYFHDHLVCYRPGTGRISIIEKQKSGNQNSFVSLLNSDTGIGAYDLKGASDQILAFDYKGDDESQKLATGTLFGRNAAPQQAPESGLDPAAQAPTNRSSVLHPGNKILCANNQAVARSKSLLGRSVPVQHRP